MGGASRAGVEHDGPFAIKCVFDPEFEPPDLQLHIQERLWYYRLHMMCISKAYPPQYAPDLLTHQAAFMSACWDPVS